MQTALDANLELLEAYDPDLAGRLRFHMPSNRVEIFTTPQSFASMRVTLDSGLKLLHSAHNPVKEAERWVGTVEIENPYNLMIMGCGLFYHVYQLVKRYQSTLKRLAIVEKDIDVVYALFSTIGLADFLRTKSTFFLIDPSPEDVRSMMNEQITPFTLDGLSIVEHPASCELNPDFYNGVRSVVDECLQGGEVLLRTKVVLGGLIQENLIRNTPCLFNLPSVSVFNNLFPNIPAFVVGAGPSLDRNVDRLADVGDRGVIIAVDTVFKKLLDRGIKPHVVVSTDPTELNAAHFEGIEELGDSVFVFSPSVNHKIPERLSGTKALIPLKTSRLLSLFSQVQNEINPLSTGVNVGQTCYNLARYLGCGPIVLVGLDFSFPVEGGTTHASGTALQRPIYKTDSPDKMRVELLDENRTLEEFEPIYIPGNAVPQVATNKFWLNYLRSMEQQIAKTEARVINCTEGGAKIEGADVRPLADAISAFCLKDSQISDNLQTVIGFFFGEPTAEGVRVLNECLDILKEAAEFAEKGASEVSALNTIANSVSPSKEIILEKLEAIRQRHLSLIQNHKVYVVLDEAADAVLQPFLRQEGRSVGDPADLENVKLTIDRYRPYFEGMKALCDRYANVIRETIDQMENTADDFPTFF